MREITNTAVPFCSSVEAMFEAGNRVGYEVPLPKADLIYVFGQTVNHQHSSLDRAAQLFHQGIAPHIGIPDLEPSAGYAGVNTWRRILLNQDVPEWSITGVIEAVNDFPPSTDAEATGLVRLAKERGWITTVIISPQIHQFRGFISTVSAAISEDISLKIYNCVGTPMHWCDSTVHSQGMAGQMKDLLMIQEWEKMVRYHAKGDLITVEQSLDYLNHRDASVLQ